MSRNAPIRSEVDIVVPCHNAERYLERALNSVFAQTYRNFRVFAVDDNSTDGTLRILKSYRQCCVIPLRSDAGPAAARNYGIRASRSPFVAFLDADDEWLPQKLERQLATLKNDPSLGMVCSLCAHTLLGNNNFVQPGESTKPRTGKLFEQLVRQCFVYTPTVVVRRGCLTDIGLFKENLKVSEDFNLWLRIAARWPIALMPEVLAVAHARLSGLSLSTSPEERLSSGVAALEDVQASSPDLSPVESYALRLTLAERIYCHGSYLLSTGATLRSRERFATTLKLQPTHWRAIMKLGLSFFPALALHPLLKFGQALRFRLRSQPSSDFPIMESSWTDA